MSAEIKNLSPQPVWGYFYDLTQIPRPTGCNPFYGSFW
jgi:dipeptidase D